MSFKIVSSVKQTTTVWHKLSVILDDKEMELSVVTVNGKIVGNAITGVATIEADYLQKPLQVKQEYFEAITAYLKSRK